MMGVFPMAEGRHDPEIYWVEPRLRGTLPLDHFHVSHSLAKILRRDVFKVTANAAFKDVIKGCAQARQDQEETWINDEIVEAYTELHQRGLAHSLECWQGDTLCGGLYGVSLGGAFFGESMFSRVPNASKVALSFLVARLKIGGYTLLDTQFLTAHLARFGAVEITRSAYRTQLSHALTQPGDFNAIDHLMVASEAYTVGGGVGAGAAGAAPGSGDTAPSAGAAGAAEGAGLAAAGALPPQGTVAGPLSGKFILQLLTKTS